MTHVLFQRSRLVLKLYPEVPPTYTKSREAAARIDKMWSLRKPNTGLVE
jgi:hypothetical protein